VFLDNINQSAGDNSDGSEDQMTALPMLSSNANGLLVFSPKNSSTDSDWYLQLSLVYFMFIHCFPSNIEKCPTL